MVIFHSYVSLPEGNSPEISGVSALVDPENPRDLFNSELQGLPARTDTGISLSQFQWPKTKGPKIQLANLVDTWKK